jgi:GAF domain-containing protein
MGDAGAEIAAAARVMHEATGLPGTLETIATVARQIVPGFEHAGLAVVTKDRVVAGPATGEIACHLDGLQIRLAEGPAPDSRTVVRAIAVGPTILRQRWPKYGVEAARLGLCSQLSVGLYDHGRALGSVSLYSWRREDLDPDAGARAEAFAVHAAIALSAAEDRRHLDRALDSRSMIGQAIGILMERFDIDAAHAYAHLVRLSNESNVKVREIAHALVHQRDQRLDLPRGARRP